MRNFYGSGGCITVRNRLRKISRREGGRKGGRGGEGEGEKEKEEEEEGENTCILTNGVGATQHNGKYVCANIHHVPNAKQ